jgi:hypothetical protein
MRWVSILFVGFLLAGIYFIQVPLMPLAELEYTMPPSQSQPLQPAPSSTVRPPFNPAPPRPPMTQDNTDQAIPERSSSFQGEESIVNQETLDLIDRIIKEVHQDIEVGHYGKAGELAYNMIFLFEQSLRAFRQFLTNPFEGPNFNIMFHKEFSGRYRFDEGKIFMGPPALQNGEGRFLVTLFHEYQHYLFHTIYQTPHVTDIVWKFYNELAAHVFENILASYLPAHYFRTRHRGGLPLYVRTLLRKQEGQRVIAVMYDLMVPDNQDPFYIFLLPASRGYIQKEDLVASFDEEFQPDPRMALELQGISAEYFRNHTH